MTTAPVGVPEDRPDVAVDRAPYTIDHRGWSTPEKVVLPPDAIGEGATDDGVVVTNRSLRRDGRRWIPRGGEIHFSRLPRRQWPLALQLLTAGGIDLVSTYVLWNHHQADPGVAPDFTGNRDVAAFLQLCSDEGLAVIIRIGPWAHGEARYGGFPDWVQNSGTRTRTDDPAYLALVQPWYEQLARQIVPFCGPAGPIVAVQVENELYDQPEHLATLKRMAQSAGITAPIWTATGWGNAQLPLSELFPVFSGYSEGFWVDAEAGWDDSFRSHFLFSDVWDDPGVGKDLAGAAWTGVVGTRRPDFPPATCELGSGMATAYHSRPVPSALDVTALANVKLGSGSAWQGYYMYVGGTNPDGPDGLQESQATGYPNDLPRFDYDFHAPVGRELSTRESFHRYRLQHAFLNAFGEQLAAMPATLPTPPTAERPLRWSLRSDGTAGFVFVNNHQAVEPLPPVDEVSFTVGLDREQISFPQQPARIPPSAVLALPVGLVVAGVRLRWATLNLITVLDAEEPVLLAHAHPGLPVQLAVPLDHRVDGGHQVSTGAELVVTVDPGPEPLLIESGDGHRLHLLVLDPDEALRVWLPTTGGRCRLFLSDADLVVRADSVVALVENTATVAAFDPVARRWSEQRLTGPATTTVAAELIRPLPAGHPVPRSRGGRAGVPTREQIDRFSARYHLRVPAIPAEVERAVLAIDLVGDVADITVTGASRPFDDVFYDGTEWAIDLTAHADAGPLDLDVRITALDPEVSIHLTPDAARTARTGEAVIHATELRLTHAVAVTRPITVSPRKA